jgi:hypothetical protein
VARAKRIGEYQADHQRNRRHYLEIDQRLDADPPDLFEVAGARDAMHDDAEHDRRDDHGDQLQEGVAENFQADGKIGNSHSQHNPEQEGNENLNKQRCIKRLSRDRRGGGDCRHQTLPIIQKISGQAAKEQQIPRQKPVPILTFRKNRITFQATGRRSIWAKLARGFRRATFGLPASACRGS